MQYVKIIISLLICIVVGMPLKGGAQEAAAETALGRLQQEGRDAYYVSDFPTALEKWEAGLNQARILNDKPYISAFLNNLGAVYILLGQNQHALDYYEQALTLARESGDRRDKALALGNIGLVYDNLGRYSRALDYYEQALVLHREFGYRQAEANTLGNIGLLYDNLGQSPRALDYYEQALVIHREIGDRQGEGVVLNSLGTVYDKLEQPLRALDYYQQALTVNWEIGNRYGKGANLSNIGNVYVDLGQPTRALGYYEQALKLKEEIGDRRGEGVELSNLGRVYDNLGQYPLALESYEQALAISRETNDWRGEGDALIGLGNIYGEWGQYPRALEYYEQTLMVRREFGDRRGEGEILANIGLVFYLLGQSPSALDYSGQALAIAREIGDRWGQRNILNNFGSIYGSLGQYSQALDYYDQALAIAHDLGDRHGEGQALTNLGVAYNNLGQYSRALEHYEQALLIKRELGDRSGEGDVLINLGLTQHNLGQYQDAYTTLLEGLNIHKALDTPSLWHAHRGLASVEITLQHNEAAISHYEQALDRIEALRAGLVDTGQRLSFMQNKLFVYDELIELLQKLHKKHPNKGYDRKALEIFERKQGRVFLEEMGKSGVRLFSGVPKRITQRELDLLNQLQQIHNHLVDERSKPFMEQDKEFIQVLEKDKRTLQAEQERLQEQIKVDHPDYYTLKYPMPVTLAELQQQVLQPGELLLVYGVMKDKTSLWLIGQKEFESYTLDIGEVELSKKIAALREALYYDWGTGRGLHVDRAVQTTQKPVSFLQLSYDLYSLLIPEAVYSLFTGQHTLHIVPSGPLYALPFEALVTSPSVPLLQEGEQDVLPRPVGEGWGEGFPHYLIEDIPITYLSSASLLKTLRESLARRSSTAHYPLLAFADPVYRRQTIQEDDRVRALRNQSYRNFLGDNFLELPETTDEARLIVDVLNAPQESDPLQLRENASRSKVFEFNTNNRLDHYAYLLFAMHGVLPGEVDRVTQSALVLSDGFLTMADVFGLQLNARLVSLSACNTGRGRQVKGEGVIGLTRAFMYAGTPAVAVTLWSVESFSAKDLNIGFFGYLSEGLAPARALQAIKIHMLQGKMKEDYRHPYYWGPFVLFGDGRAIGSKQ